MILVNSIKHIFIVELFRNNEHPFPLWSFFSYLSYPTSVLLNIQLEYYWVVVTVSVPASSWYVPYPLHKSVHKLSFIKNGYGPFRPLCRSISYPWWSDSLWMTMYAYAFLFPYFFPLSLHWIWLLPYLIKPRPHLQHNHWLRAVPSVGYLCVFIPWLIYWNSQKMTPVGIW